MKTNPAFDANERAQQRRLHHLAKLSHEHFAPTTVSLHLPPQVVGYHTDAANVLGLTLPDYLAARLGGCTDHADMLDRCNVDGQEDEILEAIEQKEAA